MEGCAAEGRVRTSAAGPPCSMLPLRMGAREGCVQGGPAARRHVANGCYCNFLLTVTLSGLSRCLPFDVHRRELDCFKYVTTA